MRAEHPHVDKLAVSFRHSLPLAFIFNLLQVGRRGTIRVIILRIFAPEFNEGRQVVLFAIFSQKPATHSIRNTLSTGATCFRFFLNVQVLFF
mmetsp:Transcript_11195/g.13223  ORF Transcript_11195/g.13223 Transcript_11195/m.13223 type:complete len:92 (-) Transcript_11195:337-612(-)